MADNPKSQGTERDKREAPWASLLGGGKGLSKFQLRSGTTKLSFIDRLRQFRRKDLAFILAGLGILFMAPLADFLFTGSGNEEAGSFGTGWGMRNALGGLGGAGGPFDYGVNGMAPGGAVGANGEVITPLDARDPASLILGLPGMGGETPKAPEASPAAPQKTWKDSFAGAAAGAAKAAVRAAGFSIPHLPLGASGLRALGFGGGAHAAGGAAAGGAAGVGAWGVPTHAAGNDSLSKVLSSPGYKGAAARNFTSGGQGFDKMKAAAGKAANNFNNLGRAANNLQKAAATPIVGAGGANTGGAGAGGKGGGMGNEGSIGKTSKSIGQSLAFMAAKQNLQHAIDLYWKQQEAWAMLVPNMVTQMANSMAQIPTTVMSSYLMYSMMRHQMGMGAGAGGGQSVQCTMSSGSPVFGGCQEVPNCGAVLSTMMMANAATGMGASNGAGGNTGLGANAGLAAAMTTPYCLQGSQLMVTASQSPVMGATCQPCGSGSPNGPNSGDGLNPASGKQENGVGDVPGMASSVQLNAPALCSSLKALAEPKIGGPSAVTGMGRRQQADFYGKLNTSAQSINQMGLALSQSGKPSACGGGSMAGLQNTKPLNQLLVQSRDQLAQIANTIKMMSPAAGSSANDIYDQDFDIATQACAVLKQTGRGVGQIISPLNKAQETNSSALQPAANQIQDLLGQLSNQTQNLKQRASASLDLYNGLAGPLGEVSSLLSKIGQDITTIKGQLNSTAQGLSPNKLNAGLGQTAQKSANSYITILNGDIPNLRKNFDQINQQYKSENQALNLIQTTLLGQTGGISPTNGLLTQLMAFTYYAVSGQTPSLAIPPGVSVPQPSFLPIVGNGSGGSAQAGGSAATGAGGQCEGSIASCASNVNQTFQEQISNASNGQVGSKVVNSAYQGFKGSLGWNPFSQWVASICPGRLAAAPAASGGVTLNSLLNNGAIGQAIATINSDLNAAGMPSAEATTASASGGGSGDE